MRTETECHFCNISWPARAVLMHHKPFDPKWAVIPCADPPPTGPVGVRAALERAHAKTTRQLTDDDGCVWPPVEWCRCCDKPWLCTKLTAALAGAEGVER